MAWKARGFKVNTGTIAEATIIGALSSTKNANKARNSAMHQTSKGKQLYFGMKLHIAWTVRVAWHTDTTRPMTGIGNSIDPMSAMWNLRRATLDGRLQPIARVPNTVTVALREAIRAQVRAAQVISVAT